MNIMLPYHYLKHSEDEFLIYDPLNFEVLHSCAIPGKSRRVAGIDLDAEGKFYAKFISISGKGKILVRWGRRSVHFWNFGTKISQLERRLRTSEDKTPMRPSKSELARNLREDLSAYADEEAELVQKRRFQSEYGLAGMSEAEMLQLAELLSLEQQPSSNTPPQQQQSRRAGSDDDGDDDDDEYQLQLAMTLSLSEMQNL